jgi:hypothetical protein
MWKGVVNGFRFLEGILPILGAVGFLTFWARTRFWLLTCRDPEKTLLYNFQRGANTPVRGLSIKAILHFLVCER